MSELFPADPVNPALSAEQVREVVAAEWGLTGALSPLGSTEDQNFRLIFADGSRAVVKIAARHTSAEALELQNAAMRHLAARLPAVATPTPMPAHDGREIVLAHGHRIRLLHWVEGVPLAHRGYLGLADLHEMGALAARVARALADFDHPALTAPNGWDIRQAGQVLAESRAALSAEWAPGLDEAMAAFDLVGAGAELPLAVMHGDLTPVNAVCLPDDSLAARPVGVLDFGDVMRSWRVGDLAAGAVGALEHPGTGDPLLAALAVLGGYHEALPLTEPEIEAFWPLVIARAAITAAISRRQVARNTGNDYAEQGVVSGLRAMRRAAGVPPALARAAARETAGLAAVPDGAAAGAWLRAQQVADLVPGIAGAQALDLSVDAETFSCGAWTDPGALRRIAGAAPVTIARWGEARLAGRGGPGRDPAPTLHLGADVFVPAGTPVAAPLPGTLRSISDGILIDLPSAHAPLQLRITGVDLDGLYAGVEVAAGQKIATVAPPVGALPAHVHVQLMLAAGLPSHGAAAHRRAWQALCPDPSPLLQLDVAAPAPPDAAAQRRAREAVVAHPQHLYYDRAPAIVRGWRHHLYDADGRCYLDMINNIAAVGHSHPRVTEAAARQFRRLNTNSRFLYDSLTRYAERIAELLPPELGRIFLVNSGSEAADLALQLAQRYTGRTDVVALAGAYHGWTSAVLGICTSPMDRPNWRTELAGWVHVAEQPDSYRGVHGADAAAYRASVRAACAAALEGPAAFVCEPLLGNQGAVELPDGYLAGVYADVRAAGGLCIADEVQVGMARTGDTFWAFEHEGVVPDIVFTAKATGNGHPLGVVACRPEIAERFDGLTAYFSSTGGGPVSCEIGIAVLDVIRDEELQANAATIGRHLKARLTELAQRHPLIGAVHGRGLYQGIDLVTDPELRTPARYEARAISERLRAAGVIMQPTGDAFNVLKVKPPLCIDPASADFFVDTLDHVLTEFT